MNLVTSSELIIAHLFKRFYRLEILLFWINKLDFRIILAHLCPLGASQFMKQYLIKTLLAFSLITGASCYSAHAAAGDLYDGGLNALAVYKFDSAGNRTVFKSGFNADWLAFDSKGNLFVADPSDSKIVKITPAGGQTDFATGIIPAGIAFDAGGNLFAIDRASTGSILKYTPSGAMTTFVADLGDGGPTGLAFDSNGNLYVSKSGNNTAGSGSIVKFAPNGTMTPFALGLFQPAGMAVDSANNVYVADLGSGSIFRFTPGGTKTTFAPGLNSPRALAFDSNGILYAGEFGSHDIVKFPGGVKTPFSHDDTFIGGLAFEPPTAYDFNQDGKPDYVLYNAITHQTAVWYLNNTDLLSPERTRKPSCFAGSVRH